MNSTGGSFGSPRRRGRSSGNGTLIPERLGGLHIDDQLNFWWPARRQSAGFSPFRIPAAYNRLEMRLCRVAP